MSERTNKRTDGQTTSSRGLPLDNMKHVFGEHERRICEMFELYVVFGEMFGCFSFRI